MTVTEITIHYKPQTPITERPTVNSSQQAATLFFENWSDNLYYKEEFRIMLLNSRNAVLGIAKVGEGGLNACVADLRIVFQTALKGNATAIIMAHNHPSGNLKPSTADINLTLKAMEIGKLLEIAVHDHIILSGSEHFSLTDNGYV